jgi:amino-acid N-acetyltransferase
MLTDRLEIVNERLAQVEIQRCTPAAIVSVKALLDSVAREGNLAPEPLPALYGACQSFWVAVEDTKIIGCVSLRSLTEDIGEIRLLAVAKDMQGVGIGHDLVTCVLQEAIAYQLKLVLAFSKAPLFFLKNGFQMAPGGTGSESVRVIRQTLGFKDLPESALTLMDLSA